MFQKQIGATQQALRMEKIILFCFLFIFCSISAQEYKFSYKLNSSISEKPTSLANIGLHKESLELISTVFDTIFTNFDSTKNKIEYLNADSLIYFEARKHKVICFNEMHNNVEHRIFTTNLLDTLYKIGFRDIVLECIDFENSIGINDRKYCKVNDGWLLAEPNQAFLIRKAQSLGMTIYPNIKTKTYCHIEEIDSFGNTTLRDTINNLYSTTLVDSLGNIIGYSSNTFTFRSKKQAENLYELYNNTADKIIFIAGAGHIFENYSKNTMEVFKNLTNCDPLTINLTQLNENSFKEKEDSVYRYTSLKKPSIIKLNDAIYLKDDFTDYTIAFPKANYINNRPDFLNSLDRKAVIIPSKFYKNATFPILCIANNKKEPKDASPYDVIEIETMDKMKDLFLPKGKFIIHVKDSTGKESFYKLSVR